MNTRLTPDDADRVTGGMAVENLADLEATNFLLDAVASRRATDGDPLASVLIAWLDEIDAEYRPADTHVLVAVPNVTPGPRSHRRRHLLMLTAAVTLSVAAGTGVAAASPGSLLFPVHRALFGPTAAVADSLDKASKLLDQVQAEITSAHGQSLTTAQLATATGQLGQAIDALISAAPSTHRTDLIARHDLLAGQLIGMAARTTTSAAPSSQPADPSAEPSPAGQVSKVKPSKAGQPTHGDSNSRTAGSSSGTGDSGTTPGTGFGAVPGTDSAGNSGTGLITTPEVNSDPTLEVNPGTDPGANNSPNSSLTTSDPAGNDRSGPFDGHGALEGGSGSAAGSGAAPEGGPAVDAVPVSGN